MVGNGESKVFELDEIQPIMVRFKTLFIKAIDEMMKTSVSRNRNDFIEAMVQETMQRKVIAIGYKDLDSYMLELKQKIQEQGPQVTKESTQQLDSA